MRVFVGGSKGGVVMSLLMIAMTFVCGVLTMMSAVRVAMVGDWSTAMFLALMALGVCVVATGTLNDPEAMRPIQLGDRYARTYRPPRIDRPDRPRIAVAASPRHEAMPSRRRAVRRAARRPVG
jgi:hypothetical protein